MTHLRLGSLVALAASLACGGQAQEPVRLAPGTRVRLTWLGDTAFELKGRLLAAHRDTLVVVYDGSTAETSVPFGGLRSVEVTRGRRSSDALGDAAFGALVGVTACVWLCPRDWFESWDITYIAFKATEIGAPSGAALGLAVGWVFGSKERWVPVPLDRLRVGVVPLPAGRLGFGAALAL